MDAAIVIAALILNPIAKRKRAALVAEPAQVVTASSLTSGPGGSSSPEMSDLGSGGGPVTQENPV